MLVKPREFPDIWTPRRSPLREAADGFGAFYEGSYQRASDGLYCRDANGLYVRNNATSGASCGCGCVVCGNGRAASYCTWEFVGNFDWCSSCTSIGLNNYMSGSGNTDLVAVDLPFFRVGSGCEYRAIVADMSTLGFNLGHYSDAACTTPFDATKPLTALELYAIYFAGATRRWVMIGRCYDSDGTNIAAGAFAYIFYRAMTSAIPIPVAPADCDNPRVLANVATTATGGCGTYNPGAGGPGNVQNWGAYNGSGNLYQIA